MDDYETRRSVALQILTSCERISRRAGSFLGQTVVDPTPLTPAQAEWFTKLAERAGIYLDHVERTLP